MAFFHQLRLLLWKNGLGVIRQPRWSLTLVIWPLVIFIIIAVTRRQFPPLMRNDCYVGPRNLPSTGFFPFLQTLMCNTDSTCHESLNGTASSSQFGAKIRNARSVESTDMVPNGSPLAAIFQPGSFVHAALANKSTAEQMAVLKLWDQILSSGLMGQPNNISLVSGINGTLLGDEALNAMLESTTLLKNYMCTVSLSAIDTSTANYLTSAVVTFCQSNDTVLEVALSTLNQLMAELMLNDPEQVLTTGQQVVSVFDQMQNKSSLWESFLAIPRLLSPSSFNQALGDAETLFTNMQGAMHAVQTQFPNAGPAVSMAHPVFAAGINLIHYLQNWPGRAVYVNLGDVVTQPNDTLRQAVKLVLQEVKIPLDQAIALTFDRNTVHSYICENSSNTPFWLTAACFTGTVDTLLGWISPEKMAKEAFLVWSQHVALSDLTFAKRLLNSTMGGPTSGDQGGSNNPWSNQSVEAQPENKGEELFLGVGQIVMEILKSIPQADMAFQSMLRMSLTSLQSATQSIDTMQVLADMMDTVVNDAIEIQRTYLMLMTNQSEAHARIDQFLDSVVKIIINNQASTEPLTCETIMDATMWGGFLCHNISNMEQTLLNNWLPLINMVYANTSGQENYSVTLPMVLSEWHRVSNSSQRFGVILKRLGEQMSAAYWVNWMKGNNTACNLTATLQQRVLLAIVKLGEQMESSSQWPQMETYIHMMNWIINYQPGVTTEPANCSLDINTMAVNCNTGLNWNQFVPEMANTLMELPNNPKVLLSCLNGTVTLLQQIYGDTLKYRSTTYLQNCSFSAYLMNLTNDLASIEKLISLQSIANPNTTLPSIIKFLESVGLSPILPLIYNGSLNASAALDVALQLVRQNQHLFLFDETDSALPELDLLTVRLLSSEGNLTLPLCLSMGHKLLTYSVSLSPGDVADLTKALEPYTNQTSIAESTLSALALLRKAMDGDPTDILLGYVRQLQGFLISAIRLRRMEQLQLPSGQPSAAPYTDLSWAAADLLRFTTPEGIERLSQYGPEAVAQLVVEKMVALLPAELQLYAAGLLTDLQAVQNETELCAATPQNCTVGVSEIFQYLEQIVQILQAAKDNVTDQLSPIYLPFLGSKEALNITAALFTPLLSRTDAACIGLANRTIYLIRLVMATPNLTVADVQDALKHSNLTLEELATISTMAGAANVTDLMSKVMAIVHVRQCFESQSTPVGTGQCVIELMNGVNNFLSNVPALRSSTAVLSLLTALVNNTVNTSCSSSPQLAITELLNQTLENIKVNIQQNGLNRPEIMNDIRVVEGLLQLVANTQPFNTLNSTLMENSQYAQEVYLEIAQWYLQRLENITSNSSLSSLLYPLYRLTEMQVALQLAQTEYSVFVENQVGKLMNELRYPIDGAGVSVIGQTTVDILQELVENIQDKLNIESNYLLSLGVAPMINATVFSGYKEQIGEYLNLIKDWVKNPNVTTALVNLSNPATDLQLLLQMLPHFLTDEQMAYLSVINNITQALTKAVAVADNPGGLQNDQFSASILEAVQSALQILSPMTVSLNVKVLKAVEDLLGFIVVPDLSHNSSRNISLLILKTADSIAQETMIGLPAEYLVFGIQMMVTYFETAPTPDLTDNWNEIIINEMKTVQSLLPPDSPAQAYISILFNITRFILKSGQGNMSLGAIFGNTSLANPSDFTSQMQQLMNALWQGSNSSMTLPSLAVFTDLGPVLEEIMSGTANPGTWVKLESMVGALLSAFNGTEVWGDIPAGSSMAENVIGALVNNMKAENELIVSLQKPLITLMSEIEYSMNTTHFNLYNISDGIQQAIGSTIQTVKQANGSLDCRDLLAAWQPVELAAGLSRDSLEAWCTVNLRPVMDAYAAAQVLYGNLTSTTEVGPATVNATAAGIARALEMLYQASINHTRVTEDLITVFVSYAANLTRQSVSPEAQAYWYQQLQEMQMRESMDSLTMLSEKLLTVAPSLQPYVDPLEKALGYLLTNQNDSFSQDVVQEAWTIFLTSMNITADPTFSTSWGSVSGLNESSVFGMITMAVAAVVEMQLFGDTPEVYQVIEQLVAANDTALLVTKVSEMYALATTGQLSGLDLLTQALLGTHQSVGYILSLLKQMNLSLPENTELFVELVGNLIDMPRQMGDTSDITDYLGQDAAVGHVPSRRRREAPLQTAREPVDDWIDLFRIDYPTLFQSVSAAPSASELRETAHVLFANPNLGVVMKGVTGGVNSSKEDSIDSALGMLSYFTMPELLSTSSVDVLRNAVNMLPEGFPFSALVKNLTESPETMALCRQTAQTAYELSNTSLTDEQFTRLQERLRAQVCALENTDSGSQLVQALYMAPGQLCNAVLPSLQSLARGVQSNKDELAQSLYQTFIGDPSSYVIVNWQSLVSQSIGFNASTLKSLNITITTPAATNVTVGQLLRNETAFLQEANQHVSLDLRDLSVLTGTTLPKNNLEILSWLINLQHCNDSSALDFNQTQEATFVTVCSMSLQDRYSLMLLLAKHVDTKQLIYSVMLSEDMQTALAAVLQITKHLTDTMSKLAPSISYLQTYLLSVKDLNLMANTEFRSVVNQPRSSMSTRASFTTLAKAVCSNGIMALFGITQLPTLLESPSLADRHEREEMIKTFKIPTDASPFCMSMYLDMVNTTGGAIAWAFLKPMLMGQVLYSPDTPVTRAIMELANRTLQQFADLKTNSEDWIESSNFVMNASKLLTNTLPMLQNSLSNAFVKKFIEMQTDIDVSMMEETLRSFTNMSAMLEKNKNVLNQITTLSTLMVNISSCIRFGRYRGFNSSDELNSVAQNLAKDRNLYASVIFDLPSDQGGQGSSSPLPPKISYTIRMHMDNLMRTDRVRAPYFVKDPHISARQTLRYNRGFVYLQESVDRAIIQIQTGQSVSGPAVQLQPFPYPCHLRDEYLEAISYVFPLMLMIAWVLFVAEFVKKLVYERELRLHEYMKMMGVNPLSHFFAWFLESAAYLVFTVSVLTLVLKFGRILPKSDGFLLFLYLCDYSLSIVAISYMISSFFNKTYIAGLSGSLVYVLCFFPFIVVIAMESELSFSMKNALGLISPTAFSYASQYISRYEAQGEGIQWSNVYMSPVANDTTSFGCMCWLMLLDSMLYFLIGAYIRKVFPGNYGIPSPWYFPVTPSFWTSLCGCRSKQPSKVGRGLLFANIMQKKQPVFSGDDKGKGQNAFTSQTEEELSCLLVGVGLYGLTKTYGDRAAVQNLNMSFYEGHVTTLLGHNGAGKTTTMSLLTGLFAPTSGTIEVYGRDMQANIDDIRQELGVCMQYDVHFDHMTTKEHLLLYGQIKAPHWSQRELHEQVRKTLEETGMYAHRHKLVGTLSGGMKRKLSISIAFIGGSRLVVLDEPTTGVDPCSRRNIWDIVMQHKQDRTIIMSTHHLDEAEVLSDRIAFLERGGLKCCGSPLELKDKLGQGYKLTFSKKNQSLASGSQIDGSELKAFIQAHIPEAQLQEAQVGDAVYSLPPFTSTNALAYRSLLSALDANLDALQLGCYGISDTTLEEVFLSLTDSNPQCEDEDSLPSISENVSDCGSINSLPEDLDRSFGDKLKLTKGSTTASGLALAWQQMSAMVVKRFHHSRRDWKGLISQILLPVLFVICAMGLGSIRSDLQHYQQMTLSPELYNIGPSYSFFSNQIKSSDGLVDAMMSFPGLDNGCLDTPDNPVCRGTEHSSWESSGDPSQPYGTCTCTRKLQVCKASNYQPPHKQVASSQIIYNLSGIDVEHYLAATANDFIRNRYGGFVFGSSLPPDLQMDVNKVAQNLTLTKVWYNPEGHHTMPAYLNSLNNFILRANLPADKDPQQYGIYVSSHPYFGRRDDEDAVVQGMMQILVALCMLTGYAIMTASFAIYEVTEHHSGSKMLQHIAGISEPFYWIVNFLYDMALYMIPVTLTVAVIAAFQIPAFNERQNLAAVTLLLVLYGFSTFPWMYLLSGVFKDTEMAFITYVSINLFISINTILSSSIIFFLSQLSMQDNETIKVIFQKMCKAFLVFPQFSFGNGLMELARNDIEVQILKGYNIDAYKNPFSTEALGWMFISSIIQGLLFFSLRLLLNKSLIRSVRRLIWGINAPPQVADGSKDVDVAAEHRRMASGVASSDILQVNQLTKVYRHLGKRVQAVKRLSVGIPAGECFGLLGVNGAGKTTTFRMLTGDISPTEGTAQIKDCDGRLVDIMECRKMGINIGYCPQVDALDELLTGEEHLYFYARIQGIPKRDIDGLVNYLVKKLELGYHRKNVTNGYSCGTRRKLSTALALIGHPQILLLDEPSSGMDPRTKRHLWKIITEEVKGKSAVVLTSHSMEECEALCTRLAIMVKGQFSCLGSLQHIKNRFGSGFTVKMYLARASVDVEAISRFMQRNFPGTFLKDQHFSMAEYHVPVASGSVADIFHQLESNKAALQIRHFSVSQTTLDEVFINFAMGSMEMETIQIHSEDSESLNSTEPANT